MTIPLKIDQLRYAVSAAIPRMTFFSGGQPAELETRAHALQACGARQLISLSFMFAGANQQPTPELWSGLDPQDSAAQVALAHRATNNRAAHQGACASAMEHS